MAKKTRADSSGDLAYRIESIKGLFTSLEKEIETLRQTGEIAQPGCWIDRYQARGTGGTYWYYKSGNTIKPIDDLRQRLRPRIS